MTVRRAPKDIPAGPGALDAVREAVQTYLGYRGDPLDQGVTWRQMIQQGFAVQARGPGGSNGPGATVPGAYTPIGVDPLPDLTPPPTATGLTVSSGFSTVFISWDAPIYTQGHGHGQTNIYGVVWAEGDPTPPTFSEAVRLGSAGGFLTLYNLPTTLGTRWAIWIKWQSVDGVESTAPAGGTNGAQVTTGRVGNSDLGPLVITADKISAGTYEGINLVRNGGAEDGTVAWALVETAGTGGALTSDASDRTGGSRSFRITRALGANGGAFGCLAFPVIPGETYSVKLRLRGNTASTAGMYLRASQKATYPTGGYVTQALRDSVTDLVADGPIPAAWALREYTYTAPAGVFWVSFCVYHWVNSTALDLFFDDVLFGRQITASSIAAGSIAVGSAAIADGAIRNALIANAAIDDAKIANLSALKLTVGDGTIGGLLKSTNYLAGTSGWVIRPDGTAEFAATAIRGQLVASQIDTRGLTIRDAAGNVLLSSGIPLSNDSASMLGFNSSWRDWTGAYPSGWVDWSNGAFLTRDTAVVEVGSPYTCLWNTAGNPNVGMSRTYAFASPLPAGTYLDGSFSYFMRNNIGGGKPGYLIRLYTNSAGTTFVDNVVAVNDQTVGGWQRQSFVVGAGGAPIYSIQIFQMAAWIGMPGESFNGSLNFGAMTFEVREPIRASNASTFIANASIGTAQINTLNASVITAGTITTDRIQVGAVSVASDAAGVASGASFSATPNIVFQNDAVVSLNSTGAQTFLSLDITITLSGVTGLTFANGFVRPTMDGNIGSIKATDSQMNFLQAANGGSMQVSIHVQLRNAPAAGVHNYGFYCQLAFTGASGALTASGSYSYRVNAVISENKV